MAAFKIEISKAKSLLTKLGFAGAKKANEKKVVKFLTSIPDKDDLDDDDLDKKDQKLFDDVCEAVAKDRKIQLTGGDDEGDDEEDSKPVKKASKKEDKKSSKKAKAKPKKGKKDDDDEEEDEKPSKKKAKKSGGGGPSNKDKVFELWLKSADPGKDAKKWTKKFPEISENTIRGWISNWKKGPGEASYPRASAGRDKEIKKALKNQK